MLSLSVQEQGASATLRGAILLYGAGPQSGETFATVHDVAPIKGRPEIMAGRLVNEADMVGLMQGLSKAGSSHGVTWLDERLLAKGNDRMVWWNPPGHRAMFFEKSKYNERTFTGGAVCPVPGLVWMAVRGVGLFVYAIKGGDRPCRDTALFQAPFFNVWGSGEICRGNVDLPAEEQTWSPDAWESVLFGSRFTHPNFTQKARLTRKQDPATFWKRMVGTPAASFPEGQLVELPLTVADLLAPDVRDRLAAIPKPEGEF